MKDRENYVKEILVQCRSFETKILWLSTPINVVYFAYLLFHVYVHYNLKVFFFTKYSITFGSFCWPIDRESFSVKMEIEYLSSGE